MAGRALPGEDPIEIGIRDLSRAIEPRLYRYPAIGASSSRRAVEEFLAGVGREPRT